MLRSGYNAGERGQPPLEASWAVSLIGDALNPVAVSGSLVFASGRTRFRETGPLIALDLETGETVWTHDFGSVSSVGQPSVVDCRVYIQNSAGIEAIESTMWSLDAESGATIWAREFPSQWEHYWSPTVTSEAVYVNAGTYGGLIGYARNGGNQRFANTDLEQYDEWVAAAHGDGIYTFVEGQLRRHDPDDGNVIDTITVTWDWRGWSMLTGPVFSPDGIAYLIAPPTLYAFEVASKRLLWSQPSTFSGMPALAEGLVLAFDGQLLTAFDAATGALAWKCEEAQSLVHGPVAANGFAYVSSASATYAVDLRDGKVVWQTENGGWLSIGGGRLFIAAQDGILHSHLLSQPDGEAP